MQDLSVEPSDHDFGALRESMQRYVDDDIIPGASWAVMRGRSLVDVGCIGWADRDRKIALRPDHLFRIFSNTKLVTSCAVLLLHDEGRFGLDDPIERYIAQLGRRQVLRPGALTLTDTEPAAGPITIRHLLSHASGLSYGLIDPETLLFKAYTERKVLDSQTTLAAMVDALEGLPLKFHPGTSWEYSVATDVLARLVEIISGKPFDRFIAERIFEPLGMVDTGFVMSDDPQGRLTACYAGADLLDPARPGLTRIDSGRYPDPSLVSFPKLSGGGGLLSSLPDMRALVRSLLPGGPRLLRDETIAQMMRNQLPEGVNIRFSRLGEVPGKGFGLGGAITLAPAPYDPPESLAEFQWGGIAGTHWWISPRTGISAVLMTQRLWSFWHPFAFEFKQQVYRAMR